MTALSSAHSLMANLQLFPVSPSSSPRLSLTRSLPLPAALYPRILACSALQRRGKHEGKKKTKETRPRISEEDIYTIDKGWKTNLHSTKEMLEMAGVAVSTRLVQQLQQEKDLCKFVEAENTTPRSKHKILRVISGKAGRKKLLSPAGMDVRPMMEVVRGAIFDILQARIAGHASFSAGRWLDLYSGTGSVGIEALSRGCTEAHFVEMDPWVVSEVLKPNLKATNFSLNSAVHVMTVEAFLDHSLKPGCKLGSFDYISVTPPYEAVDYNMLLGQLSISPLVKEDTYMVVEYPSELEVLDNCGPLLKMLLRRYGRTHVAIYGPAWAQKS